MDEGRQLLSQSRFEVIVPPPETTGELALGRDHLIREVKAIIDSRKIIAPPKVKVVVRKTALPPTTHTPPPPPPNIPRPPRRNAEVPEPTAPLSPRSANREMMRQFGAPYEEDSPPSSPEEATHSLPC